MKDAGRDDAPFVVRVTSARGEQDDPGARRHRRVGNDRARPAPLGASGVPATRRAQTAARRIFYGIPDVLGHAARPLRGPARARRRQRTLGAQRAARSGAGSPIRFRTREIIWVDSTAGARVSCSAARARTSSKSVAGSGSRVAQAARRRPHRAGHRLPHLDRFVDSTVGGIVAMQRHQRGCRRSTKSSRRPGSGPTGRSCRRCGSISIRRSKSPRALAPLIDPNVHSCGTVPPHGADELKQPDANLFVIGMKSYGRAPTFLMLTGYEQARSVVERHRRRLGGRAPRRARAAGNRRVCGRQRIRRLPTWICVHWSGSPSVSAEVRL